MVHLPESQVFCLPSKEMDLGFGYKFLVQFGILCGHRFHSMSGWRAFLAFLHQVSTNLVTGAFLVLGSYNLYISFSQFSAFLYFCAGYLTVVEAVFRTAFIIIRRSEITMLAGQINSFLGHPFARDKKDELLKKLSRRVVCLLAFFMLLYGLALYLNAAVIDSEIIKVFSTRGAPFNTANCTTGMSVFWIYMSGQFNFVPSEQMVILLTSTFYLYSFLMVGRLVTTDFIFFSWYWLFLEQYKLMTKKLPNVLTRGKREERVSLEVWLKYQQDLSKYLCDINKFLSPVIGTAVIFSGLKICLIAIVCVKVVHKTNIMYMVMFGVISTQRVYIYCMVGQRIKEKINKLHSTAFCSPWFSANRKLQNAALMICSAASEKAGLTLPGAPFFGLSLEFFATILSAVFTYFIVIIQIQK